MSYPVSAVRGHFFKKPFTPTYWNIPASVSLVNGFSSSYRNVKPGDVINLLAGTRGTLTLRNLIGTPERPITIINSGGECVLNTSSGWVGFYLQNCRYVKFSGNGHPAYQHGIRVARCVGFGLYGSHKTDNIEINNIRFERIDGNIRFGIHILTNATTSPNYDYNGDGQINTSDGTINRYNYVMQNISVHDNLFDGTFGQWNLSMAMYIGNSNMFIYPNEPQLSNIDIYNNTCRNIASKVIQLGSAVNNARIHNNIIDYGCQNDQDQQDMEGINVNDGIGVEVYDNQISNIHGNGITFKSKGGTIRNNRINTCGALGTYWDAGIHCALGSGQTTNNPIWVIENEIRNPVGNGIEFSNNEYLGTNTIQYNNICNPGEQFISRGNGGNYIISDNITNDNCN